MRLLVTPQESQPHQSAVGGVIRIRRRVRANPLTSHRCQNVDHMQDRMIAMQEEMARLTDTLKKSKNITLDDTSFGQVARSPAPLPLASNDGDLTSAPSPDRRSWNGQAQVKRYYSPKTLKALCDDVAMDIKSSLSIKNDGYLSDLINRMSFEASILKHQDLEFDVNSGQPSSRNALPPKQLLSVVLDTFLKGADSSTDIFNITVLYEAVNRTYKESQTLESESWTLCFNLVILLTLGAEHPIHDKDSFAGPLLQSAYAAVTNSNLIMAPRLVNVQALALFVSTDTTC